MMKACLWATTPRWPTPDWPFSDREQGKQPMLSPDGRYALVYNGEIYNYLELRSELADRWTFRTASDTEVVLAAMRRGAMRHCLG